MTFSLGEYQDIFLEEADDQLQELNKNLLSLEEDASNPDTINDIFRAAHSLKSSAAFVGLNDLSDLAHKMENLLQGIRDKTMDITPEIIDLLFKCFDEINSVISSVANGEEPDQDLSGIIEEIKNISSGASTAAPTEEAKEEASSEEKKTKSGLANLPKTSFNSDEKKLLLKGIDQQKRCFEITIFIEPDAQMKWIKAQLVFTNLKNVSDTIKTMPSEDDLTDDTIDNAVRVILLTDEELEEIGHVCDIDLITKVVASEIDLKKKDEKYILTFHKSQVILDNTVEEEVAEEVEVVEEKVVEEKKETPKEEKAEAPETKKAAPAAEKKEKVEKAKSKDKSGGVALRTVKVSVDKLDELLNNVGELVIANSGFFRLYEDMSAKGIDKSLISEFKNRMEQMSRIAKDLQSGIMKTRMVPIGLSFNRFNRLVRDLAKDCGKPIQLDIKGEDTELDKKVIDVIGEPLMHLVRNSVDHGIELPDERLAKSKPETGTVTLNAYQGGNHIYVEVSDDGKGLDVEVIKKKAIDKGLVNPEVIANMDDDQILEFIFHPGFSTAAKITDLSGRGVGMNVVKEVVNEMNGSVSIHSELGVGTRFTMVFPLTLAIIPAIMVKVEEELYAVPLSDVIETIKIADDDITTIEGHEVINLRGEILSLLRLNEFVGLKGKVKDKNKIPVVIVGYGNRKIGLIIDSLEGKLEIVIKPLDQNYMTVEGIAGASILGDGSISLILDISSMITKVIAEQEKFSKYDRQKIIDRATAKAHKEEVGDLSLSEPVEEEIQEDEPELDFETPKSEVFEEPKIEEEKSIESTVSTESLKEEKVFVFETPAQTEGESTLDLGEPEEEAVPSIGESFLIEEKDEKVSEEKAGLAVDKSAEYKSEMIYDEAVVPEKQTSITEEDIFKNETTPVESAQAEDADEKVKEALEKFKNELHQNVQNTLYNGSPDQHIKQSLNLTDKNLSDIQILANIGITQGAESLSKLIDKRVDLAIPEVRMMPVEKIPESVGNVDDVYVGVYMPIGGAIKGTILFSIPESAGFDLIDTLFSLEIGETKELTEDGESALKEITNIVGTSVLNAFSEKMGLAILPEVPTIVHDYMQSVMDSILIVHNVKNDYALVMDTEFFYEDDRIMANLLILPETESLQTIVKNLGN